MKYCAGCKLDKDETSFHKNKRNPDGRHYHCKECRKIESVEVREKRLKTKASYRERNKGNIAAGWRKYYAMHELFEQTRPNDQILQGVVTVEKVKAAEEHRKLGIL